MNHPDKATLALLEGGDLGFWRATPLRLHVRNCERCQAELNAFHRARQVLADSAHDLPPGLDWNRLAEEMTGNIRVGLAAGECVGDLPVRPRLHLRWTSALAATALAGVFAFGLWLNQPHRATPAAQDMLVASRHGIEVKGNGTSLGYVPADPGAVVVSVNARGSASARAMDDDTGQTTITEVYDVR